MKRARFSEERILEGAEGGGSGGQRIVSAGRALGRYLLHLKRQLRRT